MRGTVLTAAVLSLTLPAVAAADTRVTYGDGELRVLNEDAGIANKMLLEDTTRNGEAAIRIFDDGDPAGMSTFPAAQCSPGKINDRANPVELFCTRSAIRSVSIDIGPNEDGVTSRLNATPVTVTGNLGTDTLLTGGADDFLAGDQGDDTLDGGAGNDDVRGDDGADTVRAGDGNDKVTGGAGGDTIDAGPGDDTLTTADGYADSIDCGPGNDTIAADGSDQLTGCENVQRQDVAPQAGPSSAPDRIRPVLHAGARATQRVGPRRRRLRVRASSSEAGLVQATGYLDAGGINTALRAASAPVTVAGGGVDLTLRLTRGQLRRVTRDLRHGRRPRVHLTVAAVDAAGNTSAARRFSIRLRR
ncbi:MAG TPA: calcium-binding protein [Solirubrobacteraceae bacterium]|jgi:hypothetical protein